MRQVANNYLSRDNSLPYRPLHNLLIKDIVAYSVIGIAIAFHVFTVRAGQEWGGDFSLYIEHAVNILGGQPYTDTGFVYNPNVPFLSPRSYPPVYPFFLAPVYQLFGFDLHAMKIAGILVFAGFLLLFYRYVSGRLDSPVAQVLVVAALAFSPWCWVAKDEILPAFIFMFFLYLTILIADNIGMPEKLGWRRVLLAVTVGFTAYLAYGSRSLGLALIPALIISDVIRYRVISRTTLIAAAVFGVFYLAQNLMLETDQSYLDGYMHWHHVWQAQEPGVDVAGTSSFDISQFVSRTLARAKFNAGHYISIMDAYWVNGVNGRLRNVVYVAMGVLAISGFLGLAIRRASTGDYVIMVYVAVLLLVPFLQDRYLLPLIPLYLLYIFRGAEILFARGMFAATRGVLLNGAVPVVIAGVILFSYIGSYSTRNFGDFETGVETKESVELFEYIRTATPENSLIVFRKPRILALFTGRHSIRYHTGDNAPDLWDYLVMIGATHVIVVNQEIIPRDVIPEEPGYVKWVERNSSKLELVFKNRKFRVFRMDA